MSFDIDTTTEPSSNDFADRRVTVMGLGAFGGGTGVVRFLVERGAHVTVTDLRTEADLAASLAELDDCPPQRLHLGGHQDQDFTETDLVVVNPAVPRDNRFLELARQAGVPLTSEMNLFWQFNRGQTIGVTGSNGKSTTTALIHALLQADGRRCWLGGNIGRSLLPIVDQIAPDDWVVLELSSFQLDDLDRLKRSPHVAVVTNFSPNHLDWHGTLAAYRSAKQSILRWQRPGDIAILNGDDPDVSCWSTSALRWRFGCGGQHAGECFPAGWISGPTVMEAGSQGEGETRKQGDKETGGAIVRDGGGEYRLPLGGWLQLPGRHNFQNALAAVCAAWAVGASEEAIESGLRGFTGLPHRLQFVGEAAGRRFYNDSLATTPESTQVALDAFSSPVVLLAGGYDKQIDLTEMARSIAQRTKAVALMGQTAEGLEAHIHHFAAQPTDRRPPTQCCASFREAFAWAVGQSAPGDIVLLSPGCASYDWFRNFADRGEQFVALVDEYRAAPQ
jgi:UDP-N-acetylmuramoylalanine--D-glutamate ligase